MKTAAFLAGAVLATTLCFVAEVPGQGNSPLSKMDRPEWQIGDAWTFLVKSVETEKTRRLVEFLSSSEDNPFDEALRPRPPIKARGFNRYLGLAIKGATLGVIGPPQPAEGLAENVAVTVGFITSIGLVVAALFAIRRGSIRTAGIAAILCGVALVAYNLFNFSPASSGGLFYTQEARAALAVGALLLAAGIFMYRHGRHHAPRAAPKDSS